MQNKRKEREQIDGERRFQVCFGKISGRIGEIKNNKMDEINPETGNVPIDRVNNIKNINDINSYESQK